MDQNKKLFDEFKPIHDAYAQDKAKHADEFHAQGIRVLDVVRDWERRLCHGMEKGRYASYSAKLAEKFWDEVRRELPLVDEIGVKVTKA